MNLETNLEQMAISGCFPVIIIFSTCYMFITQVVVHVATRDMLHMLCAWTINEPHLPNKK